MHEEEINHECVFCHIRCVSNNDLTRHIKVHTDKKPFKCDVCKRQFWTKQNLKNHYTKYTVEKCDFCKRGFHSKTQLNRHITSSHNSETPYECNICYKEFRSKNNLMEHRKAHDEEILLECTICHNMRCTSKIQLTTQKPFKCNICSKPSRSKTDKTHRRIHDEEIYYYCDTCHTWCISKKSVKVQTNEEPFRCDPCKKHFWTKQNLENHSIIRTGKIPKCDFCNKIFHSIFDLRRHITLMHTSDTPFECYICYKEFGSKNDFMEHKKKHDEEVRLRCDNCSKQFQTISNSKTLHAGKKPFECSICNKQFQTEFNLNRHIILHSGGSVFTEDNVVKLDMENPPECPDYSNAASSHEKIKFLSDESDEKCSYDIETKLDDFIIDEPCKIKIEDEDSQFGREQQRLELKREDSDDSFEFVTTMKVDIDEIIVEKHHEIKTEYNEYNAS